jgi:hypothetical protein
MSHRRDGFNQEMTKLAISAGLALGALQGRIAQGARVAPKLLGQFEHAAASGARATPALGAAVRNAGQDVRATMGMNKALANPTTQAMQGRVANAIKAETANPAAMRGTNQLSNAYEGYMNVGNHTTAYTPEHMGAVMGINPSEIKLRTGATALMPKVAPPTPAGVTGPLMAPGATAAGTVPARRRPLALQTTIPARPNPLAATVAAA